MACSCKTSDGYVSIDLSEIEAKTAPATEEITMNEIEYKTAGITQSSQPGEVYISVTPYPYFNVLEDVNVMVGVTNTYNNTYPFYYAIVDWGDGTWTYEGPYQNGIYDGHVRNATCKLKHSYTKAGTYEIKAAAVNIYNGSMRGWSNSVQVNIQGTDTRRANLIENGEPFVHKQNSNGSYSFKAFDKSILTDGVESTYVVTDPAYDASGYPNGIGILFDDFYRLDTLEVQFASAVSQFPTNLSVEYTTDGGTTWYSIPKYYYQFGGSNGYSPTMNFPNPRGGTISFPMFSVVCNGVRVAGQKYNCFNNEDRIFAVSDIRAYGDKRMLMYSSKDNTFNADLNNMWTTYGDATTEPISTGDRGATPKSPFRSGWQIIASTEWTEWNSLQITWRDDQELINYFRDAMISAKYGPDDWSNYAGFMYATSGSQKHLDKERHYSTNSEYIIGVANFLLHGNNLKVYNNGVEVNFLEAKNNSGQSILDKLEKAMYYMLNALDGHEGIITIKDPKNNALSEYEGTECSSNYWDNHVAFGWKSAYENALFYAALNSMASVMTYLGRTAEANYYSQLAVTCKTKYNQLFWDDTKGRYIMSINKKNVRIDMGCTFVNFMAAGYGLASPEQCERIYQWLDGERIISGERSTGSDIYGKFKYAARTLTKSVVDVTDSNGGHYWYDHAGALPCEDGTFGGYGHQMQNGGTIMYISYYDLLGRINGVSADNASARFNTIVSEFHKDQLRRNTVMSFTQNGSTGMGEYVEGVLGEFPENGLVPLTFITGFLGLTVNYQGLNIKANLPSDYEYAGVREYHFGDRTYSIQVSKTLTEPNIEYDGTTYLIRLPASHDYVITLDNRLITLN